MKCLAAFLLAALLVYPTFCGAAQLPAVTIGVGDATNPQQVSTTLQVLFLLTILSLAPAILLMTTSFIRVVIVLSFIRQAMGTMQMPPNQVIIGLAIFLTLFIMSPVIQQVNETALQPYLDQEIPQEEALDLALEPMRGFMFSQVKEGDLALLVDISGTDIPGNPSDVPTMTLIPAFMLSELSRAFQIGFLVFIPFLVIDMVVASVLMSMGMMMLPPVIISLPFKLLLFVLVDGWSLVVGSLVQSFQ